MLTQIEELRKRQDATAPNTGREIEVAYDAMHLLFGPVAELLRECEGVLQSIVGGLGYLADVAPISEEQKAGWHAGEDKARAVLAKLKGA